MKLSKVFSVIFGILGALIMAVTLVLCLTNQGTQPKAAPLPKEAAERAGEFMDALSSGDYALAGKLAYGQPDLRLASAPSGETEKLVWEAFLGTLSYTFEGGCYSEGGNVYRKATVSALDIPSVTEALPPLARDILARQVENAEDLTLIYDDNDNYRKEVVDKVLREAMKQTLASAEPKTYSVTLQLIEEDGNWWVVPDRTLLKAISGGLA